MASVQAEWEEPEPWTPRDGGANGAQRRTTWARTTCGCPWSGSSLRTRATQRHDVHTYSAAMLSEQASPLTVDRQSNGTKAMKHPLSVGVVQ